MEAITSTNGKEFYCVNVGTPHSNSYRVLYIKVSRNASEDITYFKIYDSRLNRIHSGFLLGLGTTTKQIYQTVCLYQEFPQIKMVHVLSEDAFTFLQEK